jgi:hypothetical protein
MYSSSGRPLVHGVLYGVFFGHLCKQSGRWKDVLDCLCEGKSISKLQIVIEKKLMGIMTYKQHLFFKVISIQI